jgi:hypothetical protein
MSQRKSFLRRLGFSFQDSASTPSTSSASSTSSQRFRAAYTMDGCGHDLSYTHSVSKRSSKAKPASPFTRAAYTLDGQGLDLAPKYPYGSPKVENGEVLPSQDWAVERKGFRSLYTMDWKPQPCSFELRR